MAVAVLFAILAALNQTEGRKLSIDHGALRILCGNGDCSIAVDYDVEGRVYIASVARHRYDEAAQARSLDPGSFTSVDIETGAGNDYVRTEALLVPRAFRIATGSGDDVLDRGSTAPRAPA